MEPAIDTVMRRYVENNEDFYAVYEAYRPDTALIARVRELIPTAHVVTPARYTCGDCLRNIPRMARIADHLPGWTWDIFDDQNIERKASLHITRIPTFIIYEHVDGAELGRIIENPASGCLERDLLVIASQFH